MKLEIMFYLNSILQQIILMSVAPGQQNESVQFEINDQEKIQMRKLKKKIQKLIKKRQQKIKQHKRQIVRRHIAINNKAQKIILGQSIQELQNNQKTQTVLIQDKKVVEQKNQPILNNVTPHKNFSIDNFWEKVLLFTHQSTLKINDQIFLRYLKSISVKQYQKQKVTITYSVRAGHCCIPQGHYSRTLIRDSEGIPISYVGQHVPNIRKLKNCMFKILLSSASNIQTLNVIDQFIQLLCQQIIPRSLNYYLIKWSQQNPQLINSQIQQQEFRQKQQNRHETMQ